MKLFKGSCVSRTFFWMFVSTVLMIPQVAKAQWTANVGTESKDEAKQGDAFLPNELWIWAGDSITWTWGPKNEPHTLTFLKPNQPRPSFAGPPVPPPAVGCDTINSESATQPSGSSYDGAGVSPNLACVNSGELMGGASYTVKFPSAGNYKFVCLIHTNMNGTVHVLSQVPASPFFAASLPFIQSDYDKQARDEVGDLISDNDNPMEEQSDFPRSANEVIMTGEVSATGGGRQYVSIVRFLPGTIHIHVGETVEFANMDPTEPHTVTFGTEPAIPTTKVGLNAAPDGDGALHATISSAPGAMCGLVLCDSVSSGFLQAAPEDAVGRAQSPAGTTRLRVTFTHAGTYNYICALHDVDGMLGTVVVK